MKLKKLNSQSPIIVFGAMLLGLASGISSINFFSDAAGIISEIFINLLKLISLPIIFLAITATITGMQDLKEMRFLGKKVFSYTIFTTLLAAISLTTLVPAPIMESLPISTD